MNDGHPFPDLVRVETSGGSHIEPPLKSWWLPLKRLQWLAAVVELDSGVHVRVEPAKYWVSGIPQVGYYDIRLKGSSSGPHDYRGAWSTLNGIEMGAQATTYKETP